MDLMKLTLHQQFTLLGEIIKSLKGAFSGKPKSRGSKVAPKANDDSK